MYIYNHKSNTLICCLHYFLNSEPSISIFFLTSVVLCDVKSVGDAAFLALYCLLNFPLSTVIMEMLMMMLPLCFHKLSVESVQTEHKIPNSNVLSWFVD